MDDHGSPVVFDAADGAVVAAWWHLPTRRATNAALVVLYTAEDERGAAVALELAQGGAAIGLSVVRVGVRGGDAARADLLGAWTWVAGFGREMQPRRLYLAGIGDSTTAVLWAASAAPFVITGVITIGPPVATVLTVPHFAAPTADAVAWLAATDAPMRPNFRTYR